MNGQENNSDGAPPSAHTPAAHHTPAAPAPHETHFGSNQQHVAVRTRDPLTVPEKGKNTQFHRGLL